MNKKLIALALLALGMGSTALAVSPEFLVPVSENRVADPSLRSAGIDALQLVTSTIPALATDSAGTTITDGFIYYVILGSSQAVVSEGLFLELRSTNTANITSTRLTPRIQGVSFSSTTDRGDRVVYFDPPIPFSNGLSMNLGPTGQGATAPNANGEFGVGVRWKQQ